MSPENGPGKHIFKWTVNSSKFLVDMLLIPLGQGVGRRSVSQAHSKPILDEGLLAKGGIERLGKVNGKLKESLNEERVKEKELASYSDP